MEALETRRKNIEKWKGSTNKISYISVAKFFLLPNLLPDQC